MRQNYNPRQVFNNAVKQMIAAGMDPKQAILSQSYLRLEVLANTSVTSYQFGVLVNDVAKGGTQSAARATENRLNLQDAFYVGSVQMLLGLSTNSTDTNFPLYTWNNALTFSTAGAATALNNLYNGALSLTVNNRVITPGWDLLQHKNINQTQLTGATNSPLDQANFSQDSTIVTDPNWVLIGSKNIQLQLNLPAAIGTLQASSSTILVMILRGVLAQNVTPVV